LGTSRVLVPKSAYIPVYRETSDAVIDAYSCLRMPRFAIRRSAVRTRLAPSFLAAEVHDQAGKGLSGKDVGDVELPRNQFRARIRER